MNLGKYEIETYYIVVNSQTEARQRIIYTGNNGEDFFIERYYGSVRDGYRGSNTHFKNLSWSDIKTHIIGESILINDQSVPPRPQIYLSISSIESIKRDGNNSLVVVDNQIEPVTLEFLTEFDYDQAYSILNYLLQSPMSDLNSLSSDIIPPVVFFNEYFFAEPIKLDGSNLPGPFSSEDGSTFLIDIDLVQFSGPNPITKNDIVSGLIYDIIDNRDGSLTLTTNDISIYKDVISSENLVTEISTPGNYLCRFHLHDLGQNQNNSTVVFAVV
jgi:hypothetical protein